jgi:3-oxoacyl-[acyl-carrier-protein] synthase III
MEIDFNGEQLARAAVTQLDHVISTLENQTGRPRTEVDYFAIHEPNPRVIEILAQKAKIPLEKIPLLSRTCGNLGSAACGVSLCHALTSSRSDPTRPNPPLIFLAAVAPGLIWGGTHLS